MLNTDWGTGYTGTLKMEAITGQWPLKPSTHASPEDVDLYDIHIKEVGATRHTDLYQRLRQLKAMEHDMKDVPRVKHDWSTRFNAVLQTIHRVQQTESRRRRAGSIPEETTMELSSEDLLKFQQAGLITPTDPQPSNLRVFSTVEPKELNGKAKRRRAITHTPFGNEFKDAFEKLKLPIPNRLFHALRLKYALTIDFRSYFHQFRLPRSMEYWNFKAGTKTYTINTIPTGATFCPLLAQIFTEATAAWLKSRMPLIHVDCYIDNVRICCDDLGYLHDALDVYYRFLDSIDVAVNENIQDVKKTDPSNYIFLGVSYNHHDRTATLSPKIRAKLEKIQHTQFSDILMGGMLQIIGILTYASSILQTPRGRYYYALKYMRRRAQQNTQLAQPARVWPSIIPTIANWATELLHMPPIRYHPGPTEKWEIFTDSSTDGFGWIAMGAMGQTRVVASRWPPTNDEHINIKETLTVLSALNGLEHEWDQLGRIGITPEITVRIDNTSALYCLKKTTSKSYKLNAAVLAVTLHKYFRYIVDVQYVKSEDNIADEPSRRLPNIPEILNTFLGTRRATRNADRFPAVQIPHPNRHA